jgi:hypothetical protein
VLLRSRSEAQASRSDGMRAKVVAPVDITKGRAGTRYEPIPAVECVFVHLDVNAARPSAYRPVVAASLDALGLNAAREERKGKATSDHAPVLVELA